VDSLNDSFSHRLHDTLTTPLQTELENRPQNRSRWRIEVPPTAYRTATLTLTITLTLTFNPIRDMVMTHIHAKGQGQRSLGSTVRVKTDGLTDRQTDGGDCITSRANAVGN